jgi:hypothetical protein
VPSSGLSGTPGKYRQHVHGPEQKTLSDLVTIIATLALVALKRLMADFRLDLPTMEAAWIDPSAFRSNISQSHSTQIQTYLSS